MYSIKEIDNIISKIMEEIYMNSPSNSRSLIRVGVLKKNSMTKDTQNLMLIAKMVRKKVNNRNTYVMEYGYYLDRNTLEYELYDMSNPKIEYTKFKMT